MKNEYPGVLIERKWGFFGVKYKHISSLYSWFGSVSI